MSMWQKRTALHQAWQLFHQKKFAQAEQLANRALKESPLAEAYYLLGLVASEQEDWLTARRQLQKSVELDPWSAPAQYSLAVLLHQLGLVSAAIPHYQKAIEISPAWPEAQTNFGNAYLDLGNLDAAIRCYQAALAARPDAQTAMYNLGTAFQAKGLITEALTCFEQAIEFNPEDSDAHNNLGSLYFAVQRYTDALSHFRQALALEPSHQYAAFNLGRTLFSQGAYGEAKTCFETLLTQDPQFLEARLQLGHTQLALADYPAAATTYRACLTTDPKLVEAHTGLGTALLEQGDIAGARQVFDQACQLNPQNPDIRVNRGLTYLLQGDFPRGWADYEWRFQQAQASLRDFIQPRWQGQPLTDKTLLIYSEQGLGDWLQFSRYLPLLRSWASTIVVEVPTPLFRLMQPLTQSLTLVAVGAELPAFDVQAPLLSLPLLLGCPPIPTPLHPLYLAYLDLQAHPPLLSPQSSLKVGLAWQANRQSQTAGKRSCPLELLLPLASLPGVVGFSLQKDATPAEKAALETSGIYDCSPYLDDFAETGAWMKQLDLVITVDTAVAHLAGTLGVTTVLMLPFVPDWRWQMHRADSPWYASVQLIRQPQAQDWVSVIQQVKALILKRVAEKGGH